MKCHKHVKFSKVKLSKLLSLVRMKPSLMSERDNCQGDFSEQGLICPLYGGVCYFPDYRHLSCKFCAGKLARRPENVET